MQALVELSLLGFQGRLLTFQLGDFRPLLVNAVGEVHEVQRGQNVNRRTHHQQVPEKGVPGKVTAAIGGRYRSRRSDTDWRSSLSEHWLVLPCYSRLSENG